MQELSTNSKYSNININSDKNITENRDCLQKRARKNFFKRKKNIM